MRGYRIHEIFWAIGILTAFIGAAGADSESWIPTIIILAGCGIAATGFLVRGKGIGTSRN